MVRNTFQKGNQYSKLRIGYKHSEETKRKIRQSNLGKKRSEETKRKIGLIMKGKKISEEHRKALIKSNIGRIKSDEEKRKIGLGNSIALKGRVPKSAFKKGHKTWNKGIQNSGFKKGNKPWNYINGESRKSGKTRYGDDWEDIRNLIYYRDSYKCQICGIKGKHHVHHKIPFRISFDNSLNNLITLCPKCHIKEEMKLIVGGKYARRK
jgi:hypothetical protein